jgi:two-component system probable response regulator PhcQ
MKHVLIVDDEPHVAAALQRALRLRFGAQLQVRACTDPLAALDQARGMACDVVIADLRMPVLDGIAFLKRFAQHHPHAVRLMLTASADFQTAQRALNDAGVFRYLSKPWGDDELAEHVQAALSHAQAMQQQRAAAQAWEAHKASPSAQELERQRLEYVEPGITRVNWGPNGEVLMSGWVSLDDDPQTPTH